MWRGGGGAVHREYLHQKKMAARLGTTANIRTLTTKKREREGVSASGGGAIGS